MGFDSQSRAKRAIFSVSRADPKPEPNEEKLTHRKHKTSDTSNVDLLDITALRSGHRLLSPLPFCRARRSLGGDVVAKHYVIIFGFQIDDTTAQLTPFLMAQTRELADDLA